MTIIYIVVTLIIGAALGYAFRGRIEHKLKAAGADADALKQSADNAVKQTADAVAKDA